MSSLQLFGRPWVVFDPKNKDHRQYYHEFLTHRTWGRCPVRFVIPSEYGDLLSLIRNKMVEYYISEEFGEVDLGFNRCYIPPVETTEPVFETL